jgi:hypothetical protein
LSKPRKRDGYTERLSIGFTPEQMRRIEELLRVRARQGQMHHKTDLIREVVSLYLARADDIPGTRAAITRRLEGRLDAVEEQLRGRMICWTGWSRFSPSAGRKVSRWIASRCAWRTCATKSRPRTNPAA